MDDARRCRAKSKQSQERCKRAAIVGHHVCTMHGGKIPVVQAAARARIDALVDPALTELLRLLESAESEAVRLAVVKDILDRAGYKPVDRSDVNMRGSGVQIYLPERGQPALPVANGHAD